MDTISNAVQVGLLVSILAIPVFVMTKGYSFAKTNVISIPLMWLLVIATAYWPLFYSDFRLWLMGFNADAVFGAEKLQHVAPELHELAMRLYSSNVGISWPVKAISGAILTAPYPALIWGIRALVKRIKLKHISNTK